MIQGQYHFTSDSINLANFVSAKTTDFLIDLGCGSGVLCLSLSQKLQRIVACDINEDETKVLMKNIKLNDLKNIEVFTCDANDLHKKIGANTADVIVCNPPYFSTGKINKNETRAMARHDNRLTLPNLADISTKLLKFGGIIYFCYPVNRTAEAITIFENRNFRVKELKFISNEKGIYLTLFKCKKGGGHGLKIKT
jgi:tRNA1(Val) A37 N6-methylase TrmN6